MRSTSLLLLASLIAPAPLIAADAPAAAPKALPGVRDAMRAFVDQREVAGAVTLVADKDGVLHLDAVGLADVAGNKPMRPDAMMWIASMTKPITGAAIMTLVDEGKLSIDDPVSKYLPEFAGVVVGDAKGARTDRPANLTVKHLMTHTSGLREPAADVARNANVLADLIPAIVAQPTSFEPGTKWSYNQSGINTLGRVVEVVSGQSYPDFLDARFFKPLGMTDTTFYPSAEQAARIAKSYKRDGDALVEAPLGFLNGRSPTDRGRYPLANGGLFSTASDYAKFLRMVLNKGTLDGKTYLSAKAVEQMTAEQTAGIAPVGFVPGSAWGLTWSLVKEPQGVTAALSAGSHGHGGAYGTQGWIDPRRGLVYVLLIQRSDFRNQGGSDGSPVRKAFQDAAASAVTNK